MKRLAVLALLVFVGCSKGADTPEPSTPVSVAPSPVASPSLVALRGTVTVRGQSLDLCLPNVDGSPAHLVGKFADVGEGTTVVITDPSGTVVGTGTLANIHGLNRRGLQADCQFYFGAAVPPEKFYTLTVGQQPAITISGSDPGDVVLVLN